MSLPTDRPLYRARRALEALRAATAFAPALDAWEDFLVYWGRAVNRCDEYAATSGDQRWAAIKPQVWNDPWLKYLRLARNTDEHGLVQVAERLPEQQKAGFAVLDLGGVVIDAKGRVGVAVGDHLGVFFHPEELKLMRVPDKPPTWIDPPDADGDPLDPVAVAEYGLRWIEDAVVIATS